MYKHYGQKNIKINFYVKLIGRITMLALGFDPKGMKPSNMQYKHGYH